MYGHLLVIHVGMPIKDSIYMLVEYSAPANKADVAGLYRIGRHYEKVTSVKTHLLLVVPVIRKRAAELAEELNVELRGEILED